MDPLQALKGDVAQAIFLASGVVRLWQQRHPIIHTAMTIAKET